jgi:hypothetical protein
LIFATESKPKQKVRGFRGTTKGAVIHGSARVARAKGHSARDPKQPRAKWLRKAAVWSVTAEPS